MKGWRRRGQRGSVVEGRVCECESGPLEVSFGICPSWSPGVPLVPCSLVHNSSDVSHRFLSRSQTAGAKSSTGTLGLCVFSPPVFSGSPWTLSVLFWFYSPDHGPICISPTADIHSHYMHYTSPKTPHPQPFLHQTPWSNQILTYCPLSGQKLLLSVTTFDLWSHSTSCYLVYRHLLDWRSWTIKNQKTTWTLTRQMWEI